MSVTLIVKYANILLIGATLLLAQGCATTTANNDVTTADNFESANRASFNFTESLDKAVIKPVAEAYTDVTPEPVRKAVTNFFNNLAYLNVILNDFLQGKWDQGLQDSLRFLYNSTAGIGGLFDVSTGIDMPAHNEDFGQTLAVWGVDRGSYLYVPLLGPNTVRDTTDIPSSILTNPLFYASSIVLFPVTALNIVNTRSNLLEASNIRDQAAIDPYVFTREAYLQQREFLVYDGNPPSSDFDEFFLEEEDENMLIIE